MTAAGSSRDGALTPLASEFEHATREQWLTLVDKAIKGADFEKRLVTRTADGIRVEPLYTRHGASATLQNAIPGQAPFTRGARPNVDGLGWEIRQRIAATEPQRANTEIMTELDGGTNGILLEIEAPGQPGCRIASAADMAAALDGMRLDLAPVELNAGLGSADAARHFLAALPKLGIPSAETRVFLGLDPIGAMARFGQLPLPIEQALAETVALAREARTATPLARTMRVDAALYHEAGATDAFELALLGATLIAYLRTFEAAGVAPADALAQISFVVAADTNQFQTLAKLRAARRIIWRIADAAGAGDAAANLHISARASMRVLAKRDPWTNMLRSTLCCAGAALGGANAITVLPFTAALGAPDDFARRAARNIQIVLQEESWLGRVVDPMGGSWYIENLTDEVAKVAWGFLQDIEAMGGVIAALDQGFVQDKTTADAGLRAKAIATGREDLTGVSAFPLLGDDGVKVAPHPPVPPLTGTQAVRPLTPHRLAEPFEALRDAADAFIAKTGNEPVVFLASLGAVIDHTARSTWIKNYLAAGGIKALTSDGYATPEDAAEAFKASGASLACICSSDAINEIHAAATATQLKQKGAGAVLMAGRPGEREAALREAGVDQFLFAGADAVATLKGLQERLGIS
ncbi:methylmalonyl-CoA mutase family protein [Hyphomicrobium sp.]|uniref:methylmalonyl-CoA mutase family protein n=1 Tax=Hyphomicrobium sp. TaxID=82 RepID=UPI002BCA9002|nr:methylmalonyl-CoA mutase family protein [Hyphomicrobium sp.]HRN88490.1 methylmalonyl-CoA mutase family protein [Hyphomicrobium sp.]HRQ27482.1 methylmalonyl-CoA mutase family protein [Hyphomicrobium sp.]